MRRRWYPRSLFGRLVIIITAGLLFAQVLAGLILFRERRDIVFDTAATHEAARVADIVKLVEAIPEERRAAIVTSLTRSDFRAGLVSAPTNPQEATKGVETAATFGALLQQNLGPGRVFRYSVDVPGPHPPLPGLPPLSASPESRASRPSDSNEAPSVGASLRYSVDVKLAEGSWLTLTSDPAARAPPPVGPIWTDLLTRLIPIILIALLAVRLSTRPLEVLSKAALDLGKDIHRSPLPEHGPIEVRRAARSFNDMQARIVEYINERTRILAAVSHDLRTPITRMRLRTEALQDSPVKTKALADLTEMQEMIESTLAYVRGVDRSAPTSDVDMIALLESLRADAEEQGETIAIEGTCALFRCNAIAIGRCIDNLVKNAITYGSDVGFAVRDERNELVIVVSDRGPGIAADQLERVFEPFYRLERSRNRTSGGTGLGLSIAREIARAAGGDIILRNRAGGGLEAELRMPRALG